MMHGSVLTADSFFADVPNWGLNDRAGQVTVATSGVSNISVFSPRQATASVPIFRVRASAAQRRDSVERSVQKIRPAIEDLANILTLPPGWNSYRAKPISPSNVIAAIGILLRCVPTDAPLPTIVPTAPGGLQLEWHTPTTEIEIYIKSPENISFFAESLTDGEEIERELRGNENILSQWIERAR